MRAVDKEIELVASGSSYYESTGSWVEWNRKVLTGLGDLIKYISIHRYWERSDDYYTFMGQSAMDFEEKIRIPAAETRGKTIRDVRQAVGEIYFFSGIIKNIEQVLISITLNPFIITRTNSKNLVFK